MKLFVVVPVFKEGRYFTQFLKSWEQIENREIIIIIVNGSPGDDTSRQINDYKGPRIVLEIAGRLELYWAGLVSLGLEMVLSMAMQEDKVILTNIDIVFEGDPLAPILNKMDENPNRQIAALVANHAGVLLSAGVLVRSWSLSINRHLMIGQHEDDRLVALVPATYLPTRFLVFPVYALEKAGLPATHRLPHYCADYEFSNRLRLHGYQPYVYTGSLVHNDEGNTGFKTFEQRTNLFQRFSRCFDIKCSYNLSHRFWFVLLTYPGWTKIPGLASHFSKIALEILIGGKRLQHTRLCKDS